MTDKVFLEMFFEQLGVDCRVTKNIITAAERKYYFDKNGSISKIKDLVTKKEFMA